MRKKGFLHQCREISSNLRNDYEYNLSKDPPKMPYKVQVVHQCTF